MIVVYSVLTHIVPLKKNLIIFQSNNGKNYTGNPRYIYENMVKRGLDKEYECVWFFLDTDTVIPGNGKKIRSNYFAFFYYLMRAKFWVFDSRQPRFMVKKKKTIFIQTWHGTPLKKLALDMDRMNMAGNQNIDTYHASFRNACADWDYLVSQNRFSTNIFRSCFDFKNRPMLEIGYPRNDVLFEKNNENDINELKKQLGLPLDKKIILYAPTWRDNDFHKKGVYKFSTQIDFDRMQQEFSDDYCMIVKYHYLVSENIDWSPYKGFVYTFDETKDIAWLYLVSDILITDYSSVMFDYSLLNRPMLFFAYDLEEYKNNLRGFYFDFINEIPGPISQDTETLIHDLKNYDETQWESKYQQYHEKFNGVDDGTASEQIVDLIIKLSKK